MWVFTPRQCSWLNLSYSSKNRPSWGHHRVRYRAHKWSYTRNLRGGKVQRFRKAAMLHGHARGSTARNPFGSASQCCTSPTGDNRVPFGVVRKRALESMSPRERPNSFYETFIPGMIGNRAAVGDVAFLKESCYHF